MTTINEYQNGKIYLIKFKDNDKLIYIGSTKDTLYKRFQNHSYHLCSITQYIQKNYNGKWDNCYIELYENYPCNSQKELDDYETIIIQKFFYDDNYIIINKNKTGGCIRKNIIKDVKKYLIDAIKFQIENNIKEYEYECESYFYNEDLVIKNNPINIKKLSAKEYAREHHYNNHKKKLEQMKEYRNNPINKEKATQKYECECGGSYLLKNKSIHFKSKLHLQYIELNH